MIYTVKKIEEDINFGCEEREDSSPVEAIVCLVSEDGMESVVRMEDALLYQRDINEGDIVYLDRDHRLEKRKYGKGIGDTVTVTVDRPLGSYHPEHRDMYYPVNYGYVEGIMALDGEEQDAYILGVDKAVEKFTGKIIAVIHRFDDNEEKWVVAPENADFTKKDIMEQVRFQEQYFRTEIRM